MLTGVGDFQDSNAENKTKIVLAPVLYERKSSENN